MKIIKKGKEVAYDLENQKKRSNFVRYIAKDTWQPQDINTYII